MKVKKYLLKNEISLQEAKKRYEELAQNLKELIYIADPVTFFHIYVNKAITKTYGWTPKEWLSDPLRWEKTIYLEDKKRIFLEIRRALRKSQDITLEYRIVTRNKQVKWIEDHLKWIKNEEGKIISIYGVAIDITERKLNELKITRLKNYSDNILTSIPTAIISCNKRLKIKSFNQACCTIFKRKKKEITEKYLSELLGREVLRKEKLSKKLLEALDTQKPSEEIEMQYRFPRAGEKTIGLRIVPVLKEEEEEEEEEEVLLLISDITEKKEMEDAIRQADKLASVGQMAAGFAHEINNPIAIIKGNAQYLQNKVNKLLAAGTFTKDDLKECSGVLGRIISEGERCGQIAGGLLQFTRKKEKKEKVLSLDINEEILMTLKISEHNLALGKIILQHKLDSRLPKVLGNSSQLRQVFMNIMLNTRDAMPRGGSLTIETSYHKKAKVVKIKFTDTGHGITKKNIERIFDPFFTTKGSGHGVGLGLSIAYGIITSHGGKIKAESKIGQGTTFTVQLPAHHQ